MTTPTKSGPLTQEDVWEVRSRSEAGEANAELAVAFDVSKSAIWRIVTRRAWADLGPKPEPTPLVEVLAEVPEEVPEVVVEVTPKPDAIEALKGELDERAAKRAAKREYMRAWRRAQGAKEKPGPERSAPCGTRSGYKAHLKYGEPTCNACREAHNAWQAENRQRRKERRAVVAHQASVV